MNKSLSESNIMADLGAKSHSPSSFVSVRNKRKRDSEDLREELSAFKEQMKNLVAMVATQSEEIRKITSTLTDIQLSNQNIETSIALLTSQNEEYNKKIEKLEVQSQDRKYISVLGDKIEEMQKGMRKTSFEIKNLPRNNKETKEVLVGLARHGYLPVEKYWK
ncbi:unnamed protein product [Euphydryas editha]|uniref:Uncharacterized protein n=1 Tax=Euphydryas editha TaxID=104508 RepID=A0AAU9VC28_EUPED|nr:unnamed protein product [Euphydryas editha]